ncbi:BQ2448_4188 [Microbotryum intermedium]|uniref:BQ2448_4188 protein n=1 Tax=Microbotryum intermedium TaxID=269621 RepID=A0A238FKI1_9BASI|nr:BQ2448_4188 [Microbotryum intermedium]
MGESKSDPVLLSLFANRFISIAEAMGRALQQTSISTNIKELECADDLSISLNCGIGLDFSCAIFAPNGDLIANAPHLPVHLGSMSFAVRYQIETLGQDGLHKGGQSHSQLSESLPRSSAQYLGLASTDVLLSNHPVAGGSHLPDITCITPVFGQDGKIIFFTASRGHHADIGGILPGSMPPTSKTIFEEGAQIKSFKVVSKGAYQRDELVRLLVDEPAQYEGCSGTRCLSDVESDLQAQIAANNKGANLIKLLIDEYTFPVVLEYMHHIRDNAELAVRNLLRRVAKRMGKTELNAIDYLDDGTPIQLRVKIDEEKGSAVFDFAGTGPEIFGECLMMSLLGNLNAPVSVTYSAIIYCLRAMVDQDIPLNQGCLTPVEIQLPPGCCLNPSDTAAVVGGNVCTSQRVTDVVLRAFEAAAASQGDCNNLTFGNGGRNEAGEAVEGFGYYETIAGGSGAGPTWDGTSGVHTHMTNTRITDPEILERRYPTILHRFEIRKGSSGEGAHSGGCGVIREIEFLEPIQCSILSERRVYAPYGLAGGSSGARGRNLWIKQARPDQDGDSGPQPRIINLGGKATVKMGRGDRIVIETPGGGGWGQVGERRKQVVGEEKSGKGSFGRGDARGSEAERRGAQEGV